MSELKLTPEKNICKCQNPIKNYYKAGSYTAATCRRCGLYCGYSEGNLMSDVTEVEHDLMDLIVKEEANAMENTNELKDREIFTSVQTSGKEEKFSTGAVRDVQEGKGRFDLIPAYPLERLAKHYENGAKRYSDNNWCKGMPVARCLDSLLRHANKYKAGMNDEDHLSAIVFNAFAIIYYEEMIRKGLLPDTLLMNRPDNNANTNDKTK